MIDRFKFYDFETTGKKPRYDVPHQYAAIETDGELNAIREIEFRGRVPIDVLAAPEALIIAGLRFSQLQCAPLSFYELMTEISGEISQGEPSCHCAFNGIRYDEEVMRHSMYRTLRQPYITQLGGNSRGDAMKLAQATYIFQPDKIVVPMDCAGRLTFKQSELAMANGIAGHKAHDAMGDVRTMLQLVKLVRSKANDVWKMFPVWTDKNEVGEILGSSELVLVADWIARSGKPALKSLHPICQNPIYQTEWALIDLSVEPRTYLGMSGEEIFKTMMKRSGPKPIARIKANAMPIILPGDHDLASSRHPVDLETCKARIKLLRSETSLAERVAQAVTLFRESYERPYYVEEQLYSDGFFPSQGDREHFDRFHAAKSTDKKAIVVRMSDPRAKELGERLLFNEWPESFKSDERATIESKLRARLTSEESVPWMTFQSALAEIEKLRETCDAPFLPILDEYEAELLERFAQSKAAE